MGPWPAFLPTCEEMQVGSDGQVSVQWESRSYGIAAVPVLGYAERAGLVPRGLGTGRL
jgi:hypothetical protein